MAIIGLSGYIGSGKDTVGKIVQDLTSPEIAEYGKFVEGKWLPMKGSSPWKIRKFAAKLKKIASLMTGIPVEKFEDQEFKKTYLGDEWTYWKTEGDDTYLSRMTVREFLQKLGTEAIRDGLHTNAWVNALFADYGAKIKYTDSSKEMGYASAPKWIITDVRFPNEAQAIKDRKGIVIRVNRGIAISENKHPSETSLDDWNFDKIIENNDTLEKLEEKVKEAIGEYI